METQPLVHLSSQIPFDKITDCDLVEPAGNTCFWIQNTLHTVHIDTASTRDGQAHELSLYGLKKPNEFKRLVWAMKRRFHPAVAQLPAALEMVNNRGGTEEDVATLLREIRDELRRNNEAILAVSKPSARADADLV